MALNPTQMVQALMGHNHMKRSTYIPLYYDLPKRDTIDACLLINRINKIPTFAGWGAARKVTEFVMYLHDATIIWWKLLDDDDDIDLEDWEVIKKEFLKAYEPKYSACTTCANFADLFMKPGETGAGVMRQPPSH
jgi:hypothetical protein